MDPVNFAARQARHFGMTSLPMTFIDIVSSWPACRREVAGFSTGISYELKGAAASVPANSRFDVHDKRCLGTVGSGPERGAIYVIAAERVADHRSRVGRADSAYTGQGRHR